MTRGLGGIVVVVVLEAQVKKTHTLLIVVTPWSGWLRADAGRARTSACGSRASTAATHANNDKRR